MKDSAKQLTVKMNCMAKTAATTNLKKGTDFKKRKKEKVKNIKNKSMKDRGFDIKRHSTTEDLRIIHNWSKRGTILL